MFDNLSIKLVSWWFLLQSEKKKRRELKYFFYACLITKGIILSSITRISLFLNTRECDNNDLFRANTLSIDDPTMVESLGGKL